MQQHVFSLKAAFHSDQTESWPLPGLNSILKRHRLTQDALQVVMAALRFLTLIRLVKRV